MSKAVVFFAAGTEECEALLVVDLLRRAKVEVTIASATGNRAITSSHKVHITADALAEDIDYSDVDMVVLPGGIPGTPNLAANKTVTDTCVSFAKSGKKVAFFFNIVVVAVDKRSFFFQFFFAELCLEF